MLLSSPILALPRRIEDVTCLECLALGRKPSIVALAHTPSRLKECFELEAPSAPLRLLRLSPTLQQTSSILSSDTHP